MAGKGIAIITARGGSKRIPRKNIRDFNGKPIIAYSIKAALDSGLFEEVMVSTDSEEIADIARKYGANVPFMRSEATSNDYATTADVILEVIGEYSKLGRTFDFISCIYPTAPFVTPARLKDASEILEREGVNQVTTVVPFSFPPQRGFILDDAGMLKYKFPEYSLMRSQDLETLYHDAGQFYFYDYKVYLECKGRIQEGKSALLLSELEVQDIDNEEDWKIAEFKYSFLHKDADGN